jgi:methionyl aminopeptidase
MSRLPATIPASIQASRPTASRLGLSRGQKGTSNGKARGGSGIALRSPEEIEALRAAGAVVAEALVAARTACTPGATTAAVNAAAMNVIRSCGATPLFLGYPSAEGAPAFPACTCISVNEEIVHGIPGGRVIREGDLVSIDCGVKLNGWCSDSAITVPVGNVSAESHELLAVADAMLATAIRMASPGIAWSEIAEAMQDLALDAGHGLVVEYVGHGIGRSLHESPQVPNCLTRALIEREDFTLRPGMVLAIEPMITLRGNDQVSGSASPNKPRVDSAEAGVDGNGFPRVSAPLFPVGVKTRRLDDGWTVVAADGSPAVHVEHTVAITRRGCDVLSAPAGLTPRGTPNAVQTSLA